MNADSTEYPPDSLATPEVIAYPYSAYEQLRPMSPLQYPLLRAGSMPGVDEPVRAWALLRYDDVHRALRDHETFSSERNELVERGVYGPLSLLYDDPPRHTRFRRLVNQAFTPRRVEAMAPWITQLAGKLLDAISAGETDIMPSFAVPLPLLVIARLLGIPEEQHSLFRQWTEAALSAGAMSEEERQQSRRTMRAYFAEVAAQRRIQAADDLITALVNAQIDGEALNEPEILGFCVLLLVAGNETTINLIGNMLHLLAARPALWRRLREDRNLVELVIEETLRLESPVQRMLRRTTRAVEISGVVIPAEAVVTPFYGAANRDPAMFPDPDAFRLDRNFKSHVAFGSGIHYCMGAPLARLEARIALNAMLDRFPTIAPGDAPAVRQRASFTVFGFQTLPLKLSVAG